MHRTCRFRNKLTVLTLVKLTESSCSPPYKVLEISEQKKQVLALQVLSRFPANAQPQLKKYALFTLIAKCLVRTSIIFRQHFFQTAISAIGRFLFNEFMLRKQYDGRSKKKVKIFTSQNFINLFSISQIRSIVRPLICTT